MSWFKKSLPPIPGGNSPKGGGKKSIPPVKGKGGAKKQLPPSKGRSLAPDPKPGSPVPDPMPVPGPPPSPKFAVLAIVVGTVLATAGIVSQQSSSPLRSTAALFALALLYGGGRYATSLLTRAGRTS